MSDYFVVDADSHVEEPEEAWNYLQDKYKDRRPFPIAVLFCSHQQLLLEVCW